MNEKEEVEVKALKEVDFFFCQSWFSFLGISYDDLYQLDGNSTQFSGEAGANDFLFFA